MSAITIDGDLVHYEVLGRGRPVVLLHGWIGSWRYWIPLMQQLHLKYRVYAIDLFGFGDSGKNIKKYGIPQQIYLLDSFMQELAIPKAAFVGHGLGGMVMINFAKKEPDKVARMMIASLPLFDPGDLNERNPANFQRPVKPIAPEEINKLTDNTIATVSSSADATVPNRNSIDRDRLKAALEGSDVTLPNRSPNHNPLLQLFNSNTLESLLGKTFKKSDTSYDKLKQDVDKTDSRVLAHSAEHYNVYMLLDTIRQLKIPVAVVHGQDDPILPPPPEDMWNYLTIGQEDRTIAIPLPGIRHFPMLEHDPFPRLVMDFLEKPDISQIAIRERWRRRSR